MWVKVKVCELDVWRQTAKVVDGAQDEMISSWKIRKSLELVRWFVLSIIYWSIFVS